MSRFEEDGDWDDDSREAILAQGRWEHNARVALSGKRGQAALRFLESALLSMPEKRLISGWLATPDGECCTVGLYIAAKEAEKRGIPLRIAAQMLALETYPDEWEGLTRTAPGRYEANDWGPIEDEDHELTVDAGKSAGLTETLAWMLGDMNDANFGSASPEDRYVRVLRWVQRELKP